jgi:hypothetical protein
MFGIGNITPWGWLFINDDGSGTLCRRVAFMIRKQADSAVITEWIYCIRVLIFK